MKTELFNLNTNTLSESALLIEKILRDIAGVADVLIVQSKQECMIMYDEKSTSPQNIQSALHAAGYPNEIAKPKQKHGVNGVCCGSCGS